MSSFQLVKLLGSPVQINLTGFNPLGAYSAIYTYHLGDSVSFNLNSYVALGTTLGNDPTNASHWQLIASSITGTPGTAGAIGATGAGVVTGGATGQVLAKINATDYNTQWKTLTKSDVGLSHVDDTSDVNKPVSTAQGLADSAIQAYSIQRANHTGTQTASTVSDFDSAADARVAIGITNHEAALDPHPQYTTNIESIVNALIFG